MNRTLKLFLALVSLCMTVFCFAQKSELRFNKKDSWDLIGRFVFFHGNK